MPPVTSTEMASLADNEKDGLFNQLKRKRNSLVEQLEEESSSEAESDVEVKPKRKIVKIIPDVQKNRQILSEDSDSEYEVHQTRSRKNGVKNKKKANVKIIKNELTKSVDFSSFRFRSGPKQSFQFYNARKQDKSENEDSDDETVGMSAYEKMIEQKKRESMAFLESLKMDEIKAGFSEVVNTIKKKKSTTRPIKSVEKQKKENNILPQRKSRRLANLAVDYSEDSLALKPSSQTIAQELKINYNVIIPAEMSFKEALKSEEMYENFCNDIKIQEPKCDEKTISYDNSVFKKLAIKDSNVAKVTPYRISSLAWYPSSEHLVVAAGSKFGNIGVWNVNSDSNPHLFKVHNENATHIKFNPFNPVEMFSSSYEGTLRCGDMVKNMFSEVFDISDQTSCSYFDILTSTTYIVALTNGQIAVVDRKTSKKNGEMKHTCHKNAIKTVNIHPLNRNVFVTAENKGSVRLWDLRKLQEQPIADITYHKRCVSSAFFSSLTGNSLLTTSFDDSICIFDSTNLTQDIKMTRRMNHNNQTGRWLSIFRASWLPNSDDIFVVGSLQDYPRRIQLYYKDFNICHLMKHENLTTITSCNAFHPFVPALAGANSSGKVFIFN